MVILSLKNLIWKQKVSIFLILASLMAGFFLVLEGIIQKTEADEADSALVLAEIPELVIFQGNTLGPNSNPANPEPKVVRKLKVVVTGYSSTEDQTDSNPFITASGTQVRDGIIANNVLPFGTRIRIPELYGDKIFVVEDRMSWKKGNYHIDIWFPTYWEAKNFGAKIEYLEVLES